MVKKSKTPEKSQTTSKIHFFKKKFWQGGSTSVTDKRTKEILMSNLGFGITQFYILVLTLVLLLKGNFYSEIVM